MTRWNRFKLAVARVLLRKTGFVAVNSDNRMKAYQAVQQARDLTYRSGHLTRAWHVGRKLRVLLRTAVRNEYAAEP